MQLDQLKRWQWALIGIVVGLVIAYVRTGVEPDDSVTMTLSFREFANEVGANDLPGGRLRIEDIVLHPPSDPNDSAYHKAVQIVTFKRAVYDEKLKGWVYKPAAVKVELPFKPPRNMGSDEYGGSFEKFLEAEKSENGAIQYHYAWWEEPRMQYLIWGVGCLVVIGGIWPTIINVLVGAGLGPQRKKEDYDLERFGGKGEEAARPSGRRAMSAAEESQLASLNANLESELAPSGASRNGGAAAAGNEQPVRKLESKPLEIAQIEKEKEDKEYKGEFYPVAKQGQKKDDNS